MTTKTRIITFGAGCLLILSGAIQGSTALAQNNGGQGQGQNNNRPQQGRMNRPGGPAAMAAAGDYIYILRNNVLTQYGAADFKELKKITFEAERMPNQNNRGGQGGQGGGFQGGGGQGGFGGGQNSNQPAPQGDDQPPVARGQGGFGGGGQGGGQGGFGGGGFGGFQGMPGMGAPGLAATTHYVYVLRGTTLMQLSVSELKVTRKITIEVDRQVPPGGQNGGNPPPPLEGASMDMPQGDPFQGGFQGQGQGQGRGQGRMQGGMQGMGMMGGAPSLTASDKYVYVLGGVTVRIYNAESLEFIKKVALPTDQPKNE